MLDRSVPLRQFVSCSFLLGERCGLQDYLKPRCLFWVLSCSLGWKSANLWGKIQNEKPGFEARKVDFVRQLFIVCTAEWRREWGWSGVLYRTEGKKTSLDRWRWWQNQVHTCKHHVALHHYMYYCYTLWLYTPLLSSVDISAHQRLRKLRRTEEETTISGTTYHKRLRTQYAWFEWTLSTRLEYRATASFLCNHVIITLERQSVLS